MIQFHEHADPGYALRTLENAKAADLTIAFALDFNTAGEKLTRKCAYGKHLGLHLLYLHPEECNEKNAFAVDTTIFNAEQKEARSIFFSGDTVDITFKAKANLEQIHLDTLFLNYLTLLVNKYPELKTVHSGGNSGIEEAALKAGEALGLETICLAPKGWLFRDISGRDIRDEVAFKKRFGEKYDYSFI